MARVKAQKHGNSVIITMPSSFGIEDGTDFFLIQKNNGVMIMIPRIDNPFETAQEGEFYTPTMNIDYVPTEREIDDF